MAGRASDGVRLALTTLTVIPISAGAIDRRAAGVAMALAPGVGAVLGASCAAVGWVALRYGLPPLPAGLIMTLLLALLTRGLHLDGLADTVDGLASYRSRGAALAIMRAPDIGPMGVAAVALVVLAQVTAFSALVQADRWLAIVLAVASGRAAITWCCRRGVPAARPEGLGSLVAGCLPTPVPLLWTAVLAILALLAVDRPWTGLVAVGVAVGSAMAALFHIRRRLGGITGDVLGAACELSTALALLLFTVR